MDSITYMTIIAFLKCEKAKMGGFEFREIVKEVKKRVLNKSNIFFSGCFLGILSIDPVKINCMVLRFVFFCLKQSSKMT